MLLKNKTIAIIGAGPAGLTMARLLQQKGIEVRVYERDKDPQARVWGGPLDLHPDSGQPAMQKAGLLERYFAMAIPMGRTLADEQGHLFHTVAPQTDTPEINRNHLRQLLLGSLTGGTVIWDRKFTALEARNGQWQLHFGNGTQATADMVIGANGGMSSVRQYVTDATVEYTGTYIIQGEVAQPDIQCPDFARLCNNNILMAAAEGITLAANPKNNNTLTYGVTFRKSEEWSRNNNLNFQDTESISTFLSGMFASWHSSYRQLFQATSFYVGLPSRKIPLDIPWKQDRPLPITLIGDAAHLMPPFAGEGVNTGLMDALLLSENLTSDSFPSIEAAVSNYEQRMFVYAGKAQQQTAENEITMHRPGFSFAKRFGSYLPILPLKTVGGQ